MKKKDVIDLILSHYEDDPRLFFYTTIKILKEFQSDGDKELVEFVSSRLMSKVKLMPKRKETPFVPELTFEDAEALGINTWVPMEKTDE